MSYNDRVVTRFLQATWLWGILGLLTGLYTHIERLYWPANGGFAFLTFGRLQIMHETILLYGWAASGFFAGLYYALQRLCQTRIWSDHLATAHFWGWQLVMLVGCVTLGFGIIQGRHGSDLEWPFDAAMLALWVLLLGNIFLTLRSRPVKYLYIALWFFLAALIAWPLIHIVNALGYPLSAGKSYPLFPGLADALVQAWFEQNLNSFLLIVPFVGLLYYFVPKASGRPVYSFRLAVLQFWTLIALSVWLGPRQLFFTALPEWLQSLGTVAGLMLLAPSLGGAVNGLMTLGRDRRRYAAESSLLFFAFACLAYALFALISALGSLKTINLYVQYTDWMVAQNHLLFYGWVGSMLWGMTYFLVPRLWSRPLHSPRLARLHFALHALGLLLLALPMAMSGVIQGLMWFARYEDGLLIYPQFLSTVRFARTFQTLEIVGYAVLIIGLVLALVNIMQTTHGARLVQAKTPTPDAAAEEIGLLPLCFGILGALVTGSLIELLPIVLMKPAADSPAKPYSALVIQGRDLYVREGCSSCHTQVVRLSLREELRYGPSAQAFEYQFQGPTLWGQKRIGPDLLRIGGKYPDLWHYQHLIDPRQTQVTSNMPAYPWLLKKKLSNRLFPAATWLADAQKIQSSLAQAGITVDADIELVAMIAYLQKLGTEGKAL